MQSVRSLSVRARGAAQRILDTLELRRELATLSPGAAADLFAITEDLRDPALHALLLEERSRQESAPLVTRAFAAPSAA